MTANNETGVLQPVGEAARIAREHGALVHTDAAQSVGKVRLEVDALGVDLLSVAGHKLYAPKGVGALYVRRNGHPTERLPNTLSVRFPGVAGSAVLEGAPRVAASTGSACHAGPEQASPVILAMGVRAGEALSSVRLTLGRGTTRDDVERAAEDLAASWRRARR